MCKFSQIAEKWSKDYQREIEYYTFQSYLSPLKDAISFFHESEIEEITAADIKRFIDQIVATGKCRQTINLRLIVINHIFKYGLVQGVVQHNPTQLVKLPRNLPKNPREMPNDSSIQIIQTHSLTNQFWMIAKCLLYLGCRRGEVMALSKDCIDFETNKVFIDKQIEYQHGEPVVKGKVKTKAGQRQIIIPHILKQELFEYCRPKEQFLFTDENGELLKLHAIRVGWYELELGITMHQLRHAYATFLFEAGVDEKIAQQMMGHSSIVTMRNTYTHIRESQLQKAAGQINAFFRIA